ncbi:MAG: MFS transporter [Inconstantimicrobium porci]|uniref:MFS transporter n=1 Tax=Inconstantimicrobium porci TaxID=2652291 RepID=UPI002A90F9BB|nr:MFS transporter [Inconstantimicrobium porci]MDY5910468.1 MFS transporter [Inconstantimicrobium porci]
MKCKMNYNNTIYACFIGYIVQAIVNNFVPLLFVTFHSTYDISIDKITMLVTFNFIVQLVIDLASVKLIDKIGYRISVIMAHIFSATGLIGLAVIPEVFFDKFIAILISVIIYAVGGGLIEVLVSPIVESCPTERKDAAMSLLHSFYCWGHVGVVLISTLFFMQFGIENWRFMTLVWAIVPIMNSLFFIKVPIAPLIKEGEKKLELKEILKLKTFWIMILLMFLAGSCEQSVSQWASAYAESQLNLSKSIGDLLGPLMFAAMMGISRAYYGKCSEKINLDKFMFISSILCFASYICISLCPVPFIGFIGCGLCGLSVGILWPGTFSMASETIKGGGTAMFALLALAGDLGCSMGPTYVGLMSGAFNDDLKKGILLAVIFPAVLIVTLIYFNKIQSEYNNR